MLSELPLARSTPCGWCRTAGTLRVEMAHPPTELAPTASVSAHTYGVYLRHELQLGEGEVPLAPAVSTVAASDEALRVTRAASDWIAATVAFDELEAVAAVAGGAGAGGGDAAAAMQAVASARASAELAIAACRAAVEASQRAAELLAPGTA